MKSPDETPSFVQRLVLSLIPKSWGESIKAESRAWIMRCPCGHEQSVWDAGGIRWKAAGRPQRLLQCPACGQRKWHVTEWREPDGRSKK